MKLYRSHAFLGAILCYFVVLSGPASCSLESLILDDQWPIGQQRPHVVFDIGATLCKRIPKGMDIRPDIYKKSPETILVPVLLEKNEIYTHAFFPGMAELFLSIFIWGWNIDCFSSGVAERNESVIPSFLKIAFAPYFKDTETVVEYIMKSRLRIYSKQHMTENPAFQRYGYDLLLLSSKDVINTAEVDMMSTMPAIMEMCHEDGKNTYQFRIPVLASPEAEEMTLVNSKPRSDRERFVKDCLSRPIAKPRGILKSFAASEKISPYLAGLFQNRSKIERRVFLEQTHVIAREIEANGGLVSKYPSYDICGKFKKDLRALGVPLEHIILVEDDPCFAVGGEQFPPICVSESASVRFSDFLSGKADAQRNASKGFDARENASFLLGILSQCRDLMKTGVSLRYALQKLRMIPAELLKNGECPFSMCCPGSDGYIRNEKDRYEHEQVIKFMQAGQILIDELKAKRLFKIQTETSDALYRDLVKEAPGSTEFKQGDDECIVM